MESPETRIRIDLKKQIERQTIQRFIANKVIDLKGCEIKDSETPDFIIQTQNGSISIELRALVTPEIKAQESLQADIVTGAWGLFRNKYQENIRVLVTFLKSGVHCKKSEIEGLSKQLFEVVESIYLANQTSKFRQVFEARTCPLSFLQKLVIETETGINYWQPLRGFVVSHIDTTALDTIILAKEEGLAKYQTNYKENWLVISANYGTKASARDFAFMGKYTANTEFDRVMVYSYTEDEVIILK